MSFLLLMLAALLGHGVLWTAAVNRLHASAVPYRIVNALSYAALAAVTVIPTAAAAWLWRAGNLPDLHGWGFGDFLNLTWVWFAYLPLCWIMAGVGLSGWIARRLRPATAALIASKSRTLRLAENSSIAGKAGKNTIGQAGTSTRDYRHSFLAKLPGNQSLSVEIVMRELAIARLPAELDGFSILHLSDLHLSGKVGNGFFAEVVELVNQERPDVVAISGDIVDKNRCIDWIPDTLGKLQSRHGVYCIFGNHDLRVDVERLRATLTKCGLVYLGGCWREIQVRGCGIVLAGNELPWFPPAADMLQAPARRADGRSLRILLSHSPDQFDWAAASDIDLMLAGHLHGGQFRLPIIGPVLSPSRRGVRYASGTFYSRPTLMHVSRGVSAEFPVRFNCRPELPLLVLRAARRESRATEP